MDKAVFLDRDVYLLPEAAEAIKTLNDHGYKVFIVEPAMIIELANKHHIDLKRSYTIGDMRSDITSGNDAGTNTILIIDKDEVIPVIAEKYVATSLKDAVIQILQLN